VAPTLTALTVRARRAAARPGAGRLAAVVLVLVTVAALATSTAGARADGARWGPTRPVVVAARDLAPGDALGSGDVRVRRLPAAAVPAAALRAVPAGAVTTVRLPIVAGEAVVPARLAPAGLTGPAALVPAGWRAVAVPRGPAGTPPLAVGDRVDVLAVIEGDGPRDDALVEGATVVATGREADSVAVPAPDAPRLAWALTHGAVVLALAGA